jgi:hypothetical protein
MIATTAAFSAQSLIPQLQNSILGSLALLAIAPSHVATHAPLAANVPVLPSTFLLEASLYQVRPTKRPTRHVTAEESRILHRAILASSEIIDEGTFIE